MIKKTKVKRQRFFIFGAVALLILLIGGTIIWYLLNQKGYQPHTDHDVFVRQLDDNSGQLDPNKVMAVGSSDVSLASELAREGPRVLSRYGGLGSPGGYGLTVTFRTRVGNRLVSESHFVLKGWQKAEETDHDVRQVLVKGRLSELNQLVAAFTAPVKTDSYRVFVLDTTDPVPDPTAHVVRGSLKDQCANGGTLLLFTLTDDRYQGGHPERPCASVNDAQNDSGISAWLGHKPSEHSSVYAGLVNVFQELSGIPAKHPTALIEVHVYTDGVENTQELDFYHHPEFLNAENRGKLNAVFDLKGVSLVGMSVILHGLPQTSDANYERQVKALDYLRLRLTTAGAKVSIQAS